MRKSRFTETEIVYAVKQAEAGVPVGEVARKYGVSLRLKQLEDENRKLKQMVAELSLDKQML